MHRRNAPSDGNTRMINRSIGLLSQLSRSVWNYREFIWSSIKNDYVTRFARSRLGSLWMIMNPLAQVAIFSLILSELLSSRLPGINNKYSYAIYLMAGTLGWSLFSEIVGKCLTVFIDNGNLMKKMSFPRIALPTILIGIALTNFFFLFLAILVVFGFLGHLPTMAIFWLIPLIILVLGFAVGIGISAGIINVFIRDTGQFMAILLQFWFWLTPVVYTLDAVPVQQRAWLSFNPMSPVIAAFQAILAYGKPPVLDTLIYPLLFASTLMALALVIYRKADEELTDAL
jgi:lipopolysaccharide transport system permease protein